MDFIPSFTMFHLADTDFCQIFPPLPLLPEPAHSGEHRILTPRLAPVHPQLAFITNWCQLKALIKLYLVVQLFSPHPSLRPDLFNRWRNPLRKFDHT